MPAAVYSVFQSSVDLANVWKKIQVGILTAFQFGVEEFDWIKKLKPLAINWSAREMTAELDLNQAYGAAAIPEGGKEARPSSPQTVTATISTIFLNKRFTISKYAQYVQQQQGMRGQLVSQLAWQGKASVRAIRAKWGDMFWGFSTGTVALLSAVGAAPTYTFKDLYGQAGLGALTHNRRVVDLYQPAIGNQPGDAVAFLNPAGPALRGISTIITVDRAANTITLLASIAGAAVNDLVVFANNVENTTLAGGTERNQNLIGIFDGLTSTTVHSVSGTTNPNWTSFSVASSGRFSGILLRKMKQAIRNRGGGEMDYLWWANGVENDMVAQLQAAERFDNPFSMEMDGQPVTKGVKIMTSRRVPDGLAVGCDSENSIGKMILLPDAESGPAWDDLDKLQDDSGYLGGIDFPCATVWVNRANTAYATGLSQS